MRCRHPGLEEIEEIEEELEEVAAVAAVPAVPAVPAVQEFRAQKGDACCNPSVNRMGVWSDGAEVSESDAYRMCILTAWSSTKEGLNELEDFRAWVAYRFWEDFHVA